MSDDRQGAKIRAATMEFVEQARAAGMTDDEITAMLRELVADLGRRSFRVIETKESDDKPINSK